MPSAPSSWHTDARGGSASIYLAFSSVRVHVHIRSEQLGKDGGQRFNRSGRCAQRQSQQRWKHLCCASLDVQQKDQQMKPIAGVLRLCLESSSGVHSVHHIEIL